MALTRQKKNLNKRYNGAGILGQYIVPYTSSSNSRYKHIDELDLAEGKTIKASLGPINLSVFPYSGRTTYVVPLAEAGRLDLIAYRFYGYSSLWWLIAYANKISDPFDDALVYAGKILDIPNIEDARIFPNPLS